MWPVSSAFLQALKASVRDVTMRVTSLDANLNPRLDITAPTIEGTVYVDTNRATRRTCQLRLINDGGKFTPTGSDFANLGTNAVFFWNGLFKIEYGLKVGSDYEYVPLGIFIVDKPEVMVEKGISVIDIDGSDLWKKFSTSTFAAPVVWAKGTGINQIIQDMATAAGITRFNLDDLSERDANARKINVPVFFEADDNRGDKLKDLCAQWDLEIYFDVNGYLTTRDLAVRRSQMYSQAPVWTFKPSEDSVMLSLTKTLGGDGIMNHIVVTGEADDGTPVVRAEAQDANGTNDSSHYFTNRAGPLTTTAIGDRVLHIRSTTYRTTAECLARAKSELAINQIVSEDLVMPVVVIPCFEGNDVIQITEKTTNTNDRYFIASFEVPMRSSTQEIKVNKVRDI